MSAPTEHVSWCQAAAGFELRAQVIAPTDCLICLAWVDGIQAGFNFAVAAGHVNPNTVEIDPHSATETPEEGAVGVVASGRGGDSAAFDLGPIPAINAEPPADETQESTRS